MNRTTIPEKLYVTFQYNPHATADSAPLAFASPYTADAAFEKRKLTQDHWAYGRGVNVEIQADESVSVTGTGKVDAGVLFIANCFPRILKNDALEGFEISRSVRRYGWSGKGNVVWRITDPRGFDLEITSENFASIIDCVDLKKGVIQGPCIWGRMGPKNILLPENSVPFQEALQRTKKISQQVNVREVRRGDIIDIINNTVPEQHQRCRYFGKLTLANTQQIVNETLGFADQLGLLANQKDAYVVQSQLDGGLFQLSGIKISSVLEQIAEPLSAQAAATQLNDYLKTSELIPDWVSVFLPEKTAGSKMKFSLVPVDTPSWGSWPRHSIYCYDNYVLADSAGKLWITYRQGYKSDPVCTLFPLTWNPDQGLFQLETELNPVKNSYWNRQHTHKLVQQECDDLSEYSAFQIQAQLPDGSFQVLRSLGRFH
jgi:hypothetical protein